MSGSVTDASAAPRRSPWYLEVADALAVGERNRRITPARTSEFIAMTPSGQSWSTSRRQASLGAPVLDLARSQKLSAYAPAI